MTNTINEVQINDRLYIVPKDTNEYRNLRREIKVTGITAQGLEYGKGKLKFTYPYDAISELYILTRHY